MIGNNHGCWHSKSMPVVTEIRHVASAIRTTAQPLRPRTRTTRHLRFRRMVNLRRRRRPTIMMTMMNTRLLPHRTIHSRISKYISSLYSTVTVSRILEAKRKKTIVSFYLSTSVDTFVPLTLLFPTGVKRLDFASTHNNKLDGNMYLAIEILTCRAVLCSRVTLEWNPNTIRSLSSRRKVDAIGVPGNKHYITLYDSSLFGKVFCCCSCSCCSFCCFSSMA
jgi:hypothetical protein